jgi:hypothetical protein
MDALVVCRPTEQELFTRKERPFAHVTSFSEFCDDVIDRNVRPTLPEEVPKHIRRLIKACWHGDMDKRYRPLPASSLSLCRLVLRC